MVFFFFFFTTTRHLLTHEILLLGTNYHVRMTVCESCTQASNEGPPSVYAGKVAAGTVFHGGHWRDVLYNYCMCSWN